jgi:hypothetical protein
VDPWVILVGAVLTTVGVVQWIRGRETVEGRERLPATLVERSREGGVFSGFVDVTMPDLTVRRIALKPGFSKPRRTLQVVVHATPAGAAPEADPGRLARLPATVRYAREHGEFAVLVRPLEQYGLAATSLVLGGFLVLAGLLGWLSIGELLLE